MVNFNFYEDTRQPHLPRVEIIDGVVNLNLCEEDFPDSITNNDEIEDFIMGMVLLQHFNIKKVTELFGDRATAAVVKELQQIYDMDTYVPTDASKLSYEDIEKSLAALMFITDKRNGNIKARQCAVGSK